MNIFQIITGWRKEYMWKPFKGAMLSVVPAESSN